MEQQVNYEQQIKRSGFNTKKTGIIGLISLGLILVVYIGGVIFFSSHFLWNTTLNGIDVSGKSVDSIIQTIENYKLQIKEKAIDGSQVQETISAADLGMTLKDKKVVSELMEEQNQYLWFIGGNNKYTVDELTAIDDEKLRAAVLGLNAFDEAFYKAPVDATLTEYVSGVPYQIVPEEEGNKLNEDLTIKAIKEAVLSLAAEVDLIKLDCYEKPSVRSTDESLKRQCELFNTYSNVEITYEFGENTEVLNGDTIHKWLSIEGDQVILSKEAVDEYVASLRKKYDTIFRPREFVTSYGPKITIDNGDYGWWMNYTAEANALYEMIKNGESGSRTPIYYQTAAQYGKNDYGNTYIEINLTAQHLFVYQDGKKVLESDIVSGNTATGHTTPDGVYGITYKETDAVLVGENYKTPVAYWMPFNKDIGLHDAYWKSEFGSDFYKTVGSHGCINLPYAVAKQIYSYVQKGTPVICYNLANTESTNITTQSPQEIAQSAIDSINKIGTVNSKSEKKIQRARTVYNKISAEAKKYVTNYNTLVQAEQAFKALKK